MNHVKNNPENNPINKNLLLPAQLTLVVAFLSAVTSLSGLFYAELYRDSEVIKAVWFVNDLITLLVALPTMLVSMILAMKGSLRANLVWSGSLWYLLYNYVFYLYGAVFNNLYLLYVLLFVLSATSLVLTLVQIDISSVKEKIFERAPRKAITVFLFMFAAALGIPWILLTMSFILSGEIPPFELTIVVATDLSFLVSLLIVSGILLLRNNPWGIVMAAIIMFKGVLYPVVLIIGGINAFVRTGSWDTFIPLYGVLWLLCLYFYWLLMRIKVQS